jgi:hypothetical protein
VSRDTARYLCIPEYTKRDERQGRGPEAISQESEVKNVNCCVENYSYVHRRLLYRDVGKTLLHARNTEGRSSDTNRTTAKAKTSRDKQRQARLRQTKAMERERSLQNQRQTRDNTSARNSLIPDPRALPIQRPRPFLQLLEPHRVLSEMVTKRWGARGCRKEVRARLHREWCPKASDRR